MDISSAISSFRRHFAHHNNISSISDINNGWCEDFAVEVASCVPSHPERCCTVIGCEEFMMGTDGDVSGCDKWDWDLLQKHWAIEAPKGLSQEQIDDLNLPLHVWVTDGLLHYDAECPEGVASFFDLPIFAKVIQASHVH